MRHSFNLIDQPWISYVGLDGRTGELGLLEVLERAPSIRELLDPSPLVVPCVHRLLLAILHRNFGPADLGEWERLWDLGCWDEGRLRDYFRQWSDRFDLFHPERPFFQTSGLNYATLSVAKLAPQLANANNPTLFDHTLDSEPPAFSPAEAARLVLVCQGFSLGGLISRQPGEPPSATAAPLATGVVIQFQGSNLFETLMLNLIIYNDTEPWESRLQDRPCWEEDGPDLGVRRPRGYLDHLTWQSRRLLLFPEPEDGGVVVRTAMLAAGARLPDGVLMRDPQFAYRKNSKKNPRPGEPAWLPLRLSTDRALWRDSTALLAAGSEHHQPPLARAWLAQLIASGKLGRLSRYRLAAAGLVSSKAKILSWRDERVPVPAAYLAEPPLVESLRDALALAEKVDLTVRSALLAATQPRRAQGKMDNEPATAAGHLRYWSLLERPFWELLEDLPGDSDAALTRWAKTLRRAGMEAFDRAVSGLEWGRLLQPVSVARTQLQRRLWVHVKPYEEVDDESGQEGTVC